MARLPRLVLPDQALHLIQRGNNRTATFFSDEDRRFYLAVLGETAARVDCAIHAYVLMTNHVHLRMTPQTATAPARLMQALGRRYVRYINARYRRSGTLWEGRYKSALIDSQSYLLACSRYIELNPVRAAMVGDPKDYPWSSYHHNALGAPDRLLTPHALYRAVGLEGYRALFQTELPPQTLAHIRQATEDGAVVGNERFRDQIGNTLQRQVTRLPHGGDRRSERYRAKRASDDGRRGG